MTSADLAFPANRDAPIAATLALSDAQGLPIAAEFDFRQTGPQSWDIDLDTDAGPGHPLPGRGEVEGRGQAAGRCRGSRICRAYRRFLELTVTGESDVDLAPLQLVADAYLLARRGTVEPFEEVR